MTHVLNLSDPEYPALDVRCCASDQKSDGYPGGKGVATLIMKTLSAANKDGDTVRAIIHTTATHKDSHEPGMAHDTYKYRGPDCNLLKTDAVTRLFDCKQGEVDICVGVRQTSIRCFENGSDILDIIKAIFMLEAGSVDSGGYLEDANSEILMKRCGVYPPTKCQLQPVPSHDQHTSASISKGMNDYVDGKLPPSFHNCRRCKPPGEEANQTDSKPGQSEDKEAEVEEPRRFFHPKDDTSIVPDSCFDEQGLAYILLVELLRYMILHYPDPVSNCALAKSTAAINGPSQSDGETSKGLNPFLQL
jgi:hypothetical protein